MAITVNGTATTTDNAGGTASSTIVVNVPASRAVGEVLVCWLAVGSNNGAVTTPSGWTTVCNLTDNGAASGGAASSVAGILSYRVVTGTEAASYTWTTATAGTKYAATMVRLGGINTTTPIRVTNTSFGGATGTTSYVAPTATTANGVTSTDQTISFWAMGDNLSNNEPATFTMPAGYTSAINRGVSSKGTAAAINNTLGQTTTGPTVSAANANTCWVGATVAFQATSTGTTLSGVTATAAASAPAGAFTADTNLSGVTATAAASAPAGAFTADTTLAGPAATATASAPAGTVIGGTNLDGPVATAAATAPAGDLSVWTAPHTETDAQLISDGHGLAVLSAVGGSLVYLTDYRWQDTTAWAFGAVASASGGLLTLACTEDYNGTVKGAPVSLVGATATAELVASSGASASKASAETWFQLSSSATLNVNDLIFDVMAGVLYAQRDVASVRTTIASAPYDPVAHRWLRFREAAGTVYWETSADGQAWSAFASWAPPFALTAFYVDLGCGFSDPGDAPVPATVYRTFSVIGPLTGSGAAGAVLATDGRSLANLAGVVGDAFIQTT